MNAREAYMQGVRLGWAAPIARAEEWVPKIEAEAVAAERTRIAEAVRGLSGGAFGRLPGEEHMRAAVLAIIEGETL
jgi:hypothetical protein